MTQVTTSRIRLTGAELALLGMSAVLVLSAHAFGAFLAFTQPSYDHATGSWFVIAHDVLNGTLYRPLESETGLGGTRYFPLYPLLIAGLVRLGLSYAEAGLLINVASWALAAGAAYMTLRTMEVQRILAGIFSVFAIGSYGTLTTVTSIRGDLLPLGFALWGVYAALKARSGNLVFVFIASLLFTLALSAKVTSLFWAAAMIVYLAMTGHRRQAMTMSALLALGAAVFLLWVNLASDGRFIDMMLVTSSGGGSLFQALLGPVRLEEMLRGSDPLAYLATIAGVVLLLSRYNQLRSNPAAVTLVSVLLMSVMIFGSRGTIHNHLVDINVAAMLMLASNYTDIRIKPNVIPLIFLFYALLIPWRHDYHYKNSWEHSARTEAQDYLAAFDDPVLSEHPGIPLALGRNPFLADAFMVNSLRGARPELHARLLADIKARRFNAIILSNVGAFDWYENGHFGGDFMQVVEANYVRDRGFGPYNFYLPRRETAPH
jgi:hypothetical protein